MIEVKSSNLTHVGYDDEKQTLKVIFKNGDEYHYSQVPVTLFQDMLKAESIGSYFGKFIRNANFKYQKIQK